MRWMNLELIIQSEASQKEKNKDHILMHIWNLEKWYWRVYLQGSSGEMDMESRLGEKGEEGEMYGKSNIEIYITMCRKYVQW